MNGILVGIFFFFLSVVSYSQKITKNPFYCYLEDYSDSELTVHDLTLLKASSDFNNDGIIDMATSDESLKGNAGVVWSLYLGLKNGTYKYLDEIFFHPLALKIKPIKFGISRLIMYSRNDAAHGYLIEYQISKSGIKEISSTPLNPGVNLIDKKKYEKLFDYLGYHPIVVCCKLSDYKKNRNYRWQPGYYLE